MVKIFVLLLAFVAFVVSADITHFVIHANKSNDSSNARLHTDVPVNGRIF